MRWLLIALVRIYRRLLSPLKPACCRFEPTCSRYAIDALREHGSIKGGLLVAWRLLRCQPFAAHGYDPVPPPGRWRHPGRLLQREGDHDADGRCEAGSTGAGDEVPPDQAARSGNSQLSPGPPAGPP